MEQLSEFLPHNPQQTVTALLTILSTLILWIQKRRAEKQKK